MSAALASTLLQPPRLTKWRNTSMRSTEFGSPCLMSRRQAGRIEASAGGEPMMAFQDAPKRMSRLFIHSSCGFQLSLGRACVAAGCRLLLQDMSTGAWQALPVSCRRPPPATVGCWKRATTGRGRGEREAEGGKNGEVERLTSQRWSLKIADCRQRGRN